MVSWSIIREFVLERDNYTCQNCDSNNDLEIHHIVPVRNGGTDKPGNLISLCKGCHDKCDYFGNYNDVNLRQKIRQSAALLEEQMITNGQQFMIPEICNMVCKRFNDERLRAYIAKTLDRRYKRKYSRLAM